MITGYEVMKYVHILMAIVAVGFNASYAIWIRRAARSPEHMAFALRGVKVLDDRFANPAYGVLLLTGLLMVLTTPGLQLTTFWILLALILFAITFVAGAGFFAVLYGLVRAAILFVVVALFFDLEMPQADFLAAFVVLCVLVYLDCRRAKAEGPAADGTP